MYSNLRGKCEGNKCPSTCEGTTCSSTCLKVLIIVDIYSSLLYGYGTRHDGMLWHCVNNMDV